MRRRQSQPRTPDLSFRRVRQNSLVDKGAFELLAPTAASVSVSGTVTDGKNGIARTSVLLTSSNSETGTVKTNAFGHFKLEGVPAGEIYIINVYSKGQSFSLQIVAVHENVTDLVSLPTEGLLADVPPARFAAGAKAGKSVNAEFVKNKVRFVDVLLFYINV